ncbi:MAG: sugar nucleotide-binding protein [Magnetococcales bacterium]|nr:sugar nucleotide-binding protein [Magnetococcales bacterium]
MIPFATYSLPQSETRQGLLLVGADGVIGSALATCLRQAGTPFFATSRRVQQPTAQLLPLDLQADPASWSLPAGLGTAYLCAAVCRLDQCRREPEHSYQINVERMVLLAERLAAEGCFIVFLSTNRVFDGRQPHVAADAPYSPTSEYGRQKASAEQRLLAACPQTAIVRLSKVLPANDALLQGWKNDLLQGRAIQPFHDVVMAPVALSSVVSLLRLIGERRQGGIWQITALQDISYAEAARQICSHLGCDPALVQARSYRDAGLHEEIYLQHSTLEVSRLQRDLGLTLPSAQAVIEMTVNP